MSSKSMVSGSDGVLLICPRCGMSMHVLESFPARNGLPEVDVFECEVCEDMILQDRTRSAAAPGAKPVV